MPDTTPDAPDTEPDAPARRPMPDWRKPLDWPASLEVTFTDREIAEWPALALLVGERPQPPLSPQQLLMPVNDMGDGEGMVSSGMWGQMSRCLLALLATRYDLPRTHVKIAPTHAAEALRASMDGLAIDPFTVHALEEMAHVALNHVNSVLVTGYALELGEIAPDLDMVKLEEELPAAPVRAASSPPAKPAPPQFTAGQAGVLIEASGDDTVIDVAIRALALAEQQGWRSSDRYHGYVSGRRTAETLDHKHEVHNGLWSAVEWLNQKAGIAPEGHAFTFERGKFILRKRGPYHTAADKGVLVESDKNAGRMVNYVALQTIVLAEWCGWDRNVNKWRRQAWRAEYDTKATAGEDETLLSVAEDAIDWLNDNAAPPGFEFDLYEDDSLGLFHRD